jgi:mannose-6-phosphate isomerase-like protein (cupin superfamily)
LALVVGPEGLLYWPCLSLLLDRAGLIYRLQREQCVVVGRSHANMLALQPARQHARASLQRPGKAGQCIGMTAELVVLGPGEGRAFWISLSEGRVKAGAGDFWVFESSPPPAGAAPPLHVHHRHDEGWFIIEGTIEFTLGSRRDRRGAGSFVFVPRGIAHSFANPGPSSARILLMGSPDVVAMVEEVGRVTGSGPPDAARVAEVFRRYDSEVVAPEASQDVGTGTY